MDEFNDSDISSLLNQIAGSSPDTMTAHKTVLGKVRRVRQRRVMAVSASAVVMVVAGAVAMVQKSGGRDGGSNIAVPLSPDDSQPIKIATTVVSLVTTTTVDAAISIDPIVTDPSSVTPSTQPLSNTTSPSNTSVVITTTPTNTQAPTNSQGPSITTTPSNSPAPSTTQAPATTPATNPPTTPPTTKAPIVATPPPTTPPPTTPPTTWPPIATPPTTPPPITTPPTTPPPITTPPTTIPELKTWSCGGGEVDYRVTSSGLVLLGTRPAVGFKVAESKAKTDEITVKFIPSTKNDQRQSAIKIKIKKSRIISTSCDDEGFNRRSDTSNLGSTDHSSSDNNDESADD